MQVSTRILQHNHIIALQVSSPSSIEHEQTTNLSRPVPMREDLPGNTIILLSLRINSYQLMAHQRVHGFNRLAHGHQAGRSFDSRDGPSDADGGLDEGEIIDTDLLRIKSQVLRGSRDGIIERGDIENHSFGESDVKDRHALFSEPRHVSVNYLAAS